MASTTTTTSGLTSAFRNRRTPGVRGSGLTLTRTPTFWPQLKVTRTQVTELGHPARRTIHHPRLKAPWTMASPNRDRNGDSSTLRITRRLPPGPRLRHRHQKRGYVCNRRVRHRRSAPVSCGSPTDTGLRPTAQVEPDPKCTTRGRGQPLVGDSGTDTDKPVNLVRFSTRFFEL